MRLATARHVKLAQIYLHSTTQAPFFNDEEFVVKRRLGKGAFSTVFLATWESMKKNVAIKTLHSMRTARALDCFADEIQTLSRLKHPHIVNFLGVLWGEASFPSMVLEQV